MFRNLKPAMRWTLAAALAFLSIPAIASAHAGNNDPNVLHVCIGNVSKVVRNVGVGGACISAPLPSAETPEHWTTQGPAGPKGDKGDKGDQGIQGIQGVQGTPGLNGTNGTNGTNGIDGTSVTFVEYFVGNQNGCPNGGAILAAGSPPVNVYVCNGADGQAGTIGATNPDPPCFDNFNRYVDCGNGTVTDSVTGLIWLQDAACAALGNPQEAGFGGLNWAAANQAAAGLKDGDCGLTDGSAPGDWRLPTRPEWLATMARAVALGCHVPLLTDSEGNHCFNFEPQFSGVTSEEAFYWSSHPNETLPFEAWFVLLHGGVLESNDKTFTLRVWPVRSGAR